MNHFSADYSSSPVSNYLPTDTPPKRNVALQSPDIASTTPAAPPPSQIFESSKLRSGLSQPSFHGDTGSRSTHEPFSFQPSRIRLSTPGNQKSRLPQYSVISDDSFNSEVPDDSDAPLQDSDGGLGRSIFRRSGLTVVDEMPMAFSAPSLMKFSTNSLHASTNVRSHPKPTGSSRSQLPRTGQSGLVPRLAQDFAKRTPAAKITEPDIVILETEEICSDLEHECQSNDSAEHIQIMVSGAAHELIDLWKSGSKQTQIEPEYIHVGPSPEDNSFEKARYIASLFLELHHPQADRIQDGQASMTSQVTIPHDRHTKPIPQILLEWLQRNHVDYQYLFDQLLNASPNVTADGLFWEGVQTLTLRGRLPHAVRLLAEADFNHAAIDTPNGLTPANYSGSQLQAIQGCVNQVIQILNLCPAIRDGNWNVVDQDWAIYRRQVEDALLRLADAVDQDLTDDESIQGNETPFANSTRRTNLPFDVYTHLKTLYSILLGDVDIITGLSQDWFEASTLLTVWWTGAKESEVAKWSFDVSRARHNEPERSHTVPHLDRLKDAFLCVTNPSNDSAFHIDTMSPVELGIGAVLQGDVQSLHGILTTLSLCVAAAFVEVGTWAGWASNTSIAGFDEEDLMVLNLGDNSATKRKDDILSIYAQQLFDLATLRARDGRAIAGWEIAFAIVSRMEEEQDIQEAISGFLDNLAMDNQEKVRRLVVKCQSLGLLEQARQISMNFGDYLITNTTEFGTALLCYAQAHSEDKVRRVTDLLNSYCLVQSCAYPHESVMDASLRELTSNPRAALQDIRESDPLAAEILQVYLAGYACVRRYYAIRDEDDADGQYRSKSVSRRKELASKALVAAISSAADSIYGGLYDVERRSAIQVDGLLTLLGESTALLAQGNQGRTYTSDQLYKLLAAVEDLQTVNDRVYQATNECMEAALRNYQGSAPPSPHAMLRKSISSGTNSNFSFSMMGSEMLSRSADSLGGRSAGSAVLLGGSASQMANRGWDWRESFGQGGTAVDVLRTLRTGIAEELGMATLKETTSV